MKYYNVKDYKNTFPHGEVFVQQEMNKEPIMIICKDWRSDEDTMIIMQLADIADRSGAKTIELDLPYLPYSRQDRATTADTAFSLKIFLDILYTSPIDRVFTQDLHSSVGEALYPGLVIRNNCNFITNIVKLYGKYVIVFPDAGASQKREATLKHLTDLEWIQAGKTRDPSTGNITGFEIILDNNVSLQSKDLLIVDDICSGGGTFLGLLKELKEERPASISLAVTHFDNMSGVLRMANTFDKVFTSKQYKGLDEDHVITIPYENLI